MQAALTARSAFVARPAAATRAPRVQQRVYAAQYTAEQLAFLERKRSSGGSVAPAAAPARGRSTSATPGLSAEQQAFLARKAQESRSPAPAAAPTRGRTSSPRPSFRANSRPAAAAPTSYSAPAPAAANGLSAEQQAFLARKAQESRSPAPAAAPTRGRTSSPRPAFRANSRPAAAAPTSYSTPAPAAANGLSAEQQAFLARKAQESRSPAPAAAPARGRSASARPSFRASAPVSNSGVRSAMSSSSSSSPSAYGASSYKFVTADEQAKLSKEQCDFLERKRAESGKRW